MDLAERPRALLRRLFHEAPEAARSAFSIRYDAAGEAVSFAMPMALILALKEA